MDPRDVRIIPHCRTKLGDQCDKLTANCQRSSTDDGPVYRTDRPPTPCAELMTPCEVRSIRQCEIFQKSGVWGKVPEGSTLIFGDTRIS